MDTGMVLELRTGRVMCPTVLMTELHLEIG